MEWFESITNVLSLLFGGSLISVVTWKFARRKADAEAKQAEAEAKKAEAEAAQEKQNYYQQMVDDIAKDRDYYKSDRDEQRDRLDKLSRSVAEWKQLTDETIDDLRRQVARNGRQLEAIRPFMCGDLSCKLRQRVIISDDGTPKAKKEEDTAVSDITPVSQDVLQN